MQKIINGEFVEAFILVDPITGEPISSSSGGGSGSGSSSGGIVGVDSQGTGWLLVVDTTATPATVTYFKLSDGTAGAPVGGFTPDADQNAATEATLQNLIAVQKDGWQAVTITGRTRDTTKDMVQNFADGTVQTIYFTTAGEYAGQSSRV